jgi:acyl carrier protein
MRQQEVLPMLTDIFRDIFEDPNLILTYGMTAEMIPQWDSMSQITLAVEIEHRFGIKIKAAEMEELRSVDELVELIDTRREARVN